VFPTLVDRLCTGVFQELIESRQADDNRAHVSRNENSQTSQHVPWHVQLPSNETDDAEV